MASLNDWREEKPLPEASCGDHECEKNLHTFLTDRRPIENRDKSYRSENCFACGADLIDWYRLDRHDLSDVDYTVEALEHEYIRHRYWHVDIDKTAVNHALRKGLSDLLLATEDRLRKYVSETSENLFRDGMQTPKRGNVIYYAQHATATCCRRCIEAWHGIDRNRSLTEAELGFMRELIKIYIQKRMPNLSESGKYVPPIRKVTKA